VIIRQYLFFNSQVNKFTIGIFKTEKHIIVIKTLLFSFSITKKGRRNPEIKKSIKLVISTSFVKKSLLDRWFFHDHWILIILRPNYKGDFHLNESKISPEVSPEP